MVGLRQSSLMSGGQGPVRPPRRRYWGDRLRPVHPGRSGAGARPHGRPRPRRSPPTRV